MKVLVIGQGGREHALLWKIKKSPKITKLYCAPGNGGTGLLAENVPLKADDIKGLADFCKKEKIDLTVVGPETPLVAGIVDKFNKQGLRIFGPSKSAARLEGSKIFTKELCRKAGIPTADFEIFDDPEKAKGYIRTKGAPIVIKADGLAAGKGVIVTRTKEEAFIAVDKIMVEKAFGAAGKRIIIEECLEGKEASIIVVSDGENIAPLASSQDHKRAEDGDKGLNTGGMGAYSPAPVVTDEIFSATVSGIIMPTIGVIKEEGSAIKGVLYAGIMITRNGPKLLEFNVRFGDPETQAILPRLDSDIVELMEKSIDGTLAGHRLSWDKRSSVCVVLASGGYPGSYEKGKEMSGIENALKIKDVLVFHAGTKVATYGDRSLRGTMPDSRDLSPLNSYVTDGGRVLNVVALGEKLEEAIDTVYKACSLIKFENMHYRKDIGRKALKPALPAGREKIC